jgi:thiamine kinase-like enzyme
LPVESKRGDDNVEPSRKVCLMELNAENVAQFLVERGLLGVEALASGDLAVGNFGRRNRNFKVSWGALGFFVKQLRETHDEDVLMMRREAACYQLAGSDETLGRLTPRLLAYDSQSNILVTELAPDAESFMDRLKRLGEIPPEFGARFGEAVGRHHARPLASFASEDFLSMFPRRIPSVLQLGRKAREYPLAQNSLGAAIEALMRNNPNLRHSLNAFCDDWRFDCLMHDDMNWDNVIAYPLTSLAPEIRLVDWELADIGDAGWDLGKILQGFLAAWMINEQPAAALKPGPQIGRAPRGLEMIRPVTLAFWSAYARTRGFNAERSRAELDRSMRFAAFQLARTAIFHSSRLPDNDPSAIELVKASLDPLQDPRQPAADLVRH